MKKIPLESMQNHFIGNGGKSNSCFLCGKTVNNPVHFVHYTTDGDLINVDEAANSQGFFPVGFDCKNRLPKDFIFPDPQK